MFRVPSFSLCDCAHFSTACEVSFVMAKRRTVEAQPRSAPNQMHSPPDQRAVGSPQALAPLAGFDVALPQSPTRGAVPRHSQETTQSAVRTPSRRQSKTPPRFSQLPTQPMDWTPTSAKDGGITGTTSPRHSQKNTQPAPHRAIHPISGMAGAGEGCCVTGSVPTSWGKPTRSHQYGQPTTGDGH